MDTLIKAGICLLGAIVMFGGLYLWEKLYRSTPSSFLFEAILGSLAEALCCVATATGFGGILVGFGLRRDFAIDLFTFFSGLCVVVFLYDRIDRIYLQKPKHSTSP